MKSSFLRITTVASVIALAFAAPSAATAAPAAPCAKQARAVTSAKKAVTKAQKAKAATPAARKQRAKRVKAAKTKHTRAKKTLASCKAKAKAKPAPAPAPVPVPLPAPAPAPAPTPAPAPPLPTTNGVLTVASASIAPTEAWSVTVTAADPPAGMAYRLVYRRLTAGGSCPLFAGREKVLPNVPTPVQSSSPWCPGPARITLYQAPAGPPAGLNFGTEISSLDVVVNPA